MPPVFPSGIHSCVLCFFSSVVNLSTSPSVNYYGFRMCLITWEDRSYFLQKYPDSQAEDLKKPCWDFGCNCTELLENLDRTDIFILLALYILELHSLPLLRPCLMSFNKILPFYLNNSCTSLSRFILRIKLFISSHFINTYQSYKVTGVTAFPHTHSLHWLSPPFLLSSFSSSFLILLLFIYFSHCSALARIFEIMLM